MKRLALFGGSFNPPGTHHQHILDALTTRFDLVIVIPCGPRPDKSATNDLPAPFRAVMVDLAFSGRPGTRVDLFDLEKESFTRNCDLEKLYACEGEVWHVVGTDLIKGGATGQSEIQTAWMDGPRLWQESRFLVLTRPGYEAVEADLPPRCEVMVLDENGASTQIRKQLRDGVSTGDALPPAVEIYIRRYGLYRSSIPNTSSRVSFHDCRWHVIHDPDNPRAVDWLDRLKPLHDSENADAILVVGGDGTMLRAIREGWRRRLPFFGLNAGHRGFLMNSLKEVSIQTFPPSEAIVRQLPLLYVEMDCRDGRRITALGFNDAWVERSTSQSAWLSISVDGEPRIKKLVSDGVLVSTAAGSTAYARSMGAPPLLIDTPAWLVVGSNVMEPDGWKFALLSQESRVQIEVLDTDKRPVKACVDGIEYPEIVSMRVRMSRSAAAEIGFFPSHDMARKITDIQFRKEGAGQNKTVGGDAC